MKAKDYATYEKESISPKLFNKKGEFLKKYIPLLEYITWNLRYILDSVKLNETAEDELESLYCIFEDYYPKKKEIKDK